MSKSYRVVDAGALQMVKNAVLRISEEQNRPVLKEMIEELDKTSISIIPAGVQKDNKLFVEI